MKKVKVRLPHLLIIAALLAVVGISGAIAYMFRQSAGITNTFVPANVDLTPYDTVYFGTPTWAGNPTPAILTIIDRCNLRGKDVILFATMDSNRGDSNIERLEEKVKMRGARVIESFTLATKNKTPNQLVNDTEAIIEMKDLRMY